MSKGLLGASLVFLVASGAYGQSSDLIDSGDLLGRGVAFEATQPGRANLWTTGFVGDFNGDGFSEVAIVESTDVDERNVAQFVHLIFGGPDWAERTTLRLGSEGTMTFGSVNGSIDIFDMGDIDRDGLSDLCFAAPTYVHPNSTASGIVYIVYGSRELDEGGFFDLETIGQEVRGTVIYTGSPTTELGGLGFAGGNVGDLNGDGRDDIALAMSGGSAPLTIPRQTEIFFETTQLPASLSLDELRAASPHITFIVPSGRASFVAPAGDVNGDGFDDVLHSTKVAGAGSPIGVFLYYGNGADSGTYDLFELANAGQAALFIDDHNQFAHHHQTAALGDLDGDGFDDFALAATSMALTRSDLPGTVTIVYGGQELSGVIRLRDVGRRTTIHSPFPLGFHADTFGAAIGLAGDVNGDGIADLAIGTPRNRPAEQGEVYVLFGQREFPEDIRLTNEFDGIHLLGSTTRGWFGWLVHTAGDFNGDGSEDFFVHERASGDDPTARGFVIFGTAAGEVPLTAATLDPTFGNVRGGTRVRIRGSGFRNGVTVRFGARAATIERVTRSEITALTPAGDELGEVPVTVALEGTTREMRDRYEYVPNLPELDLANPGERGMTITGEPLNQIGRALDIGDVTGDGIDDLLVASELLEQWAVTVVHGGVDLPDSMPAFEIGARRTLYVTEFESPREPRIMGVGVLGDVDDDGVLDFAAASSRGHAFLIFGADGTDGEVCNLEQEVARGRAVRLFTSVGSFLDWTFDGLGDLTGDGIDDFLVGLASDGPSAVSSRVVFVAGRSSWPAELDLSSAESTFYRIDATSTSAAKQVVAVGDVNDDEWPDIAISGEEGLTETPAYLLFLGPDMPAEEGLESAVARAGVVFTWDRESRSGPLRINLGEAGDVNGDGIADLLLGDEKGGIENQGMTYVVFGSRDWPPAITFPERPLPIELDGVLRILGADRLTQSSRGLGPAGDFNNDGYADVLVGAQNTDPLDPGSMSVIFGGPDMPPIVEIARLGRHGARMFGLHPITRLEESTRHAGDLNADGVLDFAFSEWSAPSFGTLLGGVHVPGCVHVRFGLSSGFPFVRADVNFDTAVNISDAQYLLNFLFLGGPGPVCDDAADINDDGAANIADAQYLLNHLFLGGPAPPAPFPERGEDPTLDELGCLGF